VEDPTANFRNAFEGETTGYGLTNALVKIIFAYAGYENAFNIANEIKVSCLSRAPTLGQLLICLLEPRQDHQTQWNHCPSSDLYPLSSREHSLLRCR
jgi:hypothetical protein